jgi:hypothetical protein
MSYKNTIKGQSGSFTHLWRDSGQTKGHVLSFKVRCIYKHSAYFNVPHEHVCSEPLQVVHFLMF